jgi:hypothetical protein
MVDFSQHVLPPEHLVVGDIRIVLPKGPTLVRTDTLGPNHLFADPSLSQSLKKPFLVSVLEDSVVYLLEVKDMEELLPIDIRREVEKKVLDDPGDKELILAFVEREKKKQWIFFREKCNKEARKYTRQLKVLESGGSGFRRVKPPKSAKTMKAPRRRYVPVSARLFNDFNGAGH